VLPQITERGLIYSLCFYHPAIKGGNRKSPIYSWFSHSNLHFLWISMHPFLSTGSVFFLFGIGCHIHRSHQDPLMILHLSWPSALRRRSWPLAALPWPWVSRNWGMFAKKKIECKNVCFFLTCDFLHSSNGSFIEMYVDLAHSSPSYSTHIRMIEFLNGSTSSSSYSP